MKYQPWRRESNEWKFLFATLTGHLLWPFKRVFEKNRLARIGFEKQNPYRIFSKTASVVCDFNECCPVRVEYREKDWLWSWWENGLVLVLKNDEKQGSEKIELVFGLETFLEILEKSLIQNCLCILIIWKYRISSEKNCCENGFRRRSLIGFGQSIPPFPFYCKTSWILIVLLNLIISWIGTKRKFVFILQRKLEKRKAEDLGYEKWNSLIIFHAFCTI